MFVVSPGYLMPSPLLCKKRVRRTRLFSKTSQKTIQAIAALLHFHESKEMSYLRVLKVLYLADRESLKETGRPITGDRVVAMEHGPVLSSVYDLIKGEHLGWPVWSGFLPKKGYRFELLQDPGNGTLSRYEIGTLRELTERYSEKNEWDMVEIVHALDMWERNDPGEKDTHRSALRSPVSDQTRISNPFASRWFGSQEMVGTPDAPTA
jgi:uncharacterized phage-associated protein